jgi:hypothetical protein
MTEEREKETTSTRVWRVLGCLAVAAACFGLGMWLRERAIFPQLVFVLCSMLTFRIQTSKHGLPIPRPVALDDLASSMRSALGIAAVFFRKGSRVWLFLQALVFGLIALLLQTVATLLFTSFGVGADWADPLGTIVAGGVAGIALGLLARRYGMKGTLADKSGEVVASLQRLVGFQTDITPDASLVLGSFVRAGFVQLFKWLIVTGAPFFFHWGVGLALGLIVLGLASLPKSKWSDWFDNLKSASANA